MQIRQSTYPIEINIFNSSHRHEHNISIQDSKEAEIIRYIGIFHSCDKIEEARFFATAIKNMGGTVPIHKVFGTVIKSAHKQGVMPSTRPRRLATMEQKDKTLIPRLEALNAELIEEFEQFYLDYKGNRSILIYALYHKSEEILHDHTYSWFFVNRIIKCRLKDMYYTIRSAERGCKKLGQYADDELKEIVESFVSRFQKIQTIN